MDNNNKRKLRRKRTIDPQDTNEANNMEFVINGSEIQFKIKETQEKLEAYQDKMRKTQLRYYVFKKITSYKTTLRKRFQKYRSTVQLMTALDDNNCFIKKLISNLSSFIQVNVKDDLIKQNTNFKLGNIL